MVSGDYEMTRQEAGDKLISYHIGQLHGTIVYYDDAGKLVNNSTYDNGVLIE